MSHESGLRQRIRNAIRAHDPAILIVGQPANGLTGPGRHDLYAVVHGVYVGLEVKTSTGRATDVQLDRIRQTRRAGGWAWIVRSTAAALGAVKFASWGPPQKGHMTDAFDIDELLNQFRKNDPPEALKPSPFDGPIKEPLEPTPFDEPEIAKLAQRNGTAAGDGDALGHEGDMAPFEILARAIDRLTTVIAGLHTIAVELKAARETQAALEETDDVTAVLLAGDQTPENPPSEPPARKRRAKP